MMYLTEGMREDGGRSVLDAAPSEAHHALYEAKCLWLVR